ncbi:MAG: hydrolase [Proteobacteria bacterium]|nr:hydrolase [Pseudomonadota bacterium]
MLIRTASTIMLEKKMKLHRIRKHEIRDPLHGAIPISTQERMILDHPFVQRLRGIRQLGFAHHPFPSATHTRFSHSVGVMHVAGMIFDSLFKDHFSNKKLERFKTLVRMAALLHDVGHGPYSHAVEHVMPTKGELYGTQSTVQATHEDYTVAILTCSSLSDLLQEQFGFSGKHVATLIDPSVHVEDRFFELDGLYLRPVLSQIISSNLDADRLDYLRRDSYFTGVRYGEVDVSWLINQMGIYVTDEGTALMGLDRSALYALENFLLARLHMFLMVYFHRKSVGFELMLQHYMKEKSCSYRIPSDLNEYLRVDDAHLWSHLHSSDHPFARMLVERRPYKTAFERHGPPEESDLIIRKRILQESEIPVIESSCIGTAFTPPHPGKPPIYLLDSSLEGYRAQPLYEAQLRLSSPREAISRLYVPRAELKRARQLMNDLAERHEQTSLLR